MSFWDTVLDIVTGGQSGLIEKEFDVGGQIVQVAVDGANDLIKIGEKEFGKVPADLMVDLLFPGALPPPGLFKSKVDDVFLLYGPTGILPAVSLFVDGVLQVAKWFHLIQTRTLVQQELDCAKFVFGDSIKDLEGVLITNFGIGNGRGLTLPTFDGNAFINLGSQYVNDGPVRNLPLLIHELTHVWQIQRSLQPELFVCDGAYTQGKKSLGIGADPYVYAVGSQWNTYGMEQQATIVQDWLRVSAFSIGSPLFRYIVGNVRTGKDDAETVPDMTVLTYLREGQAPTLSLASINPSRPAVTWPLTGT